MTETRRKTHRRNAGAASCREFQEAIRAACLKAARDAFEDAQVRGLCGEGALEAALGAIETLDLDSLPADKNDRD